VPGKGSRKPLTNSLPATDDTSGQRSGVGDLVDDELLQVGELEDLRRLGQLDLRYVT
jgi:hypothetical protein